MGHVGLVLGLEMARLVRAGRAGERLQQLPHRRDLVRLRVYGGLAEDHADAVCQRRDRVRSLRAADGPAVDRDHRRDPRGQQRCHTSTEATMG